MVKSLKYIADLRPGYSKETVYINYFTTNQISNFKQLILNIKSMYSSGNTNIRIYIVKTFT
jgi:hypothetical protein